MQLREHQGKTMTGVQGQYSAGVRRVLLCAPTGFGKSACARWMLSRTRKQTLFLVHRAELLEMVSSDLTKGGIRHGIISPNSNALPHTYHVHVGMVQTVQRRLDRLPKFEFVVSDECHLAMAAGWKSVLDHYNAAWHLGMSATPCRLDGQGLGQIYQSIVYGPSVKELTDRGWLVPAKVFAPRTDLAGLKQRAGDFIMEQAAEMLDKAQITGDAIAQYQRLGDGKRAIAFCCTVKHAEHVAETFRRAGIPAAHIEGNMPKDERRQRLADFRAGRIRYLTNVDILTTGFDDPGVGVCQFLRPTQSLALYVQMVGRVLRIADGKTHAMVLDHVGNTLSHGLPTTNREWTLEGRPVRASSPPVRQCMSCYAVYDPQPRCPYCGFVAAVAKPPRVAPRQVAGDLREFTDADMDDPSSKLATAPLKTLIAGAKSRADLHAIAKVRGYAAGWVNHMAKLKRLDRRPRA